MSAKAIVSLMIVGCLIMGFIFYRALQKAPDQQVLVGEKLKMEFLDYAKKNNASDKMLVAQTGAAQYFVSFKQEWNFEVQENNLIVTVPPLQRVPPQASIPAEDLALVQNTVREFVLGWMKERFNSQKDHREMTVEVHFSPTSQ